MTSRKIVLFTLMMVMSVFLLAEKKAEDPYETAFKKAGEEGKLVMLYFTADWCPPCQMMKKDVLPEESVQKALSAKYVFLMIDTDKQQKVAQKYEIRGIPSMVILDSKGKEVNRFSGYRDKENFVAIIDKIASDYWKAQEEESTEKKSGAQSTCSPGCEGHH